MKKINTVRTLCIGASCMTEGSAAYIKYEKNGHFYWMYAKLVKLSDKRAYFKTRLFKRNSENIILVPDDIMIITDKNIPSEIATKVLSTGTPFESHPEIRTNAEGTMNEDEYRKYIQFICKKEWKKKEWAEKSDAEKQDFYNETYELLSDILVKSCEDCRRCCRVKDKAINDEDDVITEEKFYCKKYDEFVSKYDYCKEWESV